MRATDGPSPPLPPSPFPFISRASYARWCANRPTARLQMSRGDSRRLSTPCASQCLRSWLLSLVTGRKAQASQIEDARRPRARHVEGPTSTTVHTVRPVCDVRRVDNAAPSHEGSARGKCRSGWTWLSRGLALSMPLRLLTSLSNTTQDRELSARGVACHNHASYVLTAPCWPSA